jgi:peptidoglycan L-alanyl-D-glutamate endopeptidase CwlK
MNRFSFGSKSESKLVGVHPRLVKVVRAALKTGIIDFSVVDGVRTIEEQRQYVETGVSKTMQSKHLKQADGYSHAVDLYPVGLSPSWAKSVKEIARFGLLAGVMLSVAQEEDETLTWGADWNGDGQTTDHSFFDAPHFQIEFS